MENTKIPIIDTHQHLWDLKKFKLAWLSGESKVLQQSYVNSDYDKHTASSNVVKAIYMEVGMNEEDLEAEVAWILDEIKSPDTKTCAAVIGARPNSKHFTNYIEKWKNEKAIVGCRQVLLGEDQGYCLQENFVKSVQLLGKLGKTFDLIVKSEHLMDAVELAKLCPNTMLILNHGGCVTHRASKKKK